MRKSLLIVFAAFLLATSTACAGDFGNIWNGIQKDMKSATENMKKDIDSAKASNKIQSNDNSVQSAIDEAKAERDKKLEPINKKIQEKEAQMRKVIIDTKLSASQKKAKTTLLQKEISTLKEQKEQIQADYRRKLNEFRY